MKRLIFQLLASLVLSAITLAQEMPSWSVTNAVDQLIAKNALFRPSRDGFLLRSDDNLVHFELPGKIYTRSEKGWDVEIVTSRWREEKNQVWQGWNEPQPPADAFVMGLIRVEVASSGVKAAWQDDSNFSGSTAPTESLVNHRLGPGYVSRGASRPSIQVAPGAGNNAASGSRNFVHEESPTPRTLPPANGGIFRKGPDGKLTKMLPHQGKSATGVQPVEDVVDGPKETAATQKGGATEEIANQLAGLIKGMDVAETKREFMRILPRAGIALGFLIGISLMISLRLLFRKKKGPQQPVPNTRTQGASQ